MTTSLRVNSVIYEAEEKNKDDENHQQKAAVDMLRKGRMENKVRDLFHVRVFMDSSQVVWNNKIRILLLALPLMFIGNSFTPTHFVPAKGIRCQRGVNGLLRSETDTQGIFQ